MVPFEHNGKWILAEHPRWVGTGGITGSRSGSGRGAMTFDRALGPDGTMLRTGPFMKFDSRDEAELYLAQFPSPI